MRKRYRCERVKKIDKICQFFFKCEDGEQEELMVINIIAKPEQYEVGKFYWWSDDPAGY